MAVAQDEALASRLHRLIVGQRSRGLASRLARSQSSKAVWKSNRRAAPPPEAAVDRLPCHEDHGLRGVGRFSQIADEAQAAGSHNTYLRQIPDPSSPGSLSAACRGARHRALASHAAQALATR